MNIQSHIISYVQHKFNVDTQDQISNLIVQWIFWRLLTLNLYCCVCINVRVINTEIYVWSWVLCPECQNTIHVCIECFVHIVANQLWNLRGSGQIWRRKCRIDHFLSVKSVKKRIYKKLRHKKLDLVLRTRICFWKLISILVWIRIWLHLDSCL